MVTKQEPIECSRCGKEITDYGHVYWILIPVLALALGIGPSRPVCRECADTINGIGALLLKVLVVAGVLGAITYWVQG